MPLPSLILLGHGSTENPDSSEPTHRHAEALRQSGRFAEVKCAFWKEQPQFHEIESLVEGRDIYVVPNFISEGYFTRQIIPREMQLDGPVTRRPDGRVVKYCDPVGIHPSMTRLLISRAREVAPEVDPAETTVLVVGHGTKLNRNSREAVRAQAELIRDGGHGYADVIDTYMEEAPLISDWRDLARTPNVVVVPFFISDGLHSYEDIPVMLGLESEPAGAASKAEVFSHNPRELDGRQLYYSAAIGTDPLLAEVVLDQIDAFDQAHPDAVPEDKTDRPALATELKRWIANGVDRMLQVAILPCGEGYELRHVDDRESSADTLAELSGTEALLDWARWDAEGEYRPRPAGQTLRPGWRVECADERALHHALDTFYPGGITHWSRHLAGQTSQTPLRETLGRQTGMYRKANTITDDQAEELIREGCAAAKCARTIVYPLEDERALQTLPAEKADPRWHGDNAIPFLCVQACCFPVAGAREVAKQAEVEQG